MQQGPSTLVKRRLDSLENHLQEENPVLIQAVRHFRELDAIAYKLGILDPDDSYATRVPWWPLISILGTFSAGKSTFINTFLDDKLQRTGNQAVDDKFTVLCYSKEAESHTLPGLALDADPRFPFYQISRDIDQVVEGEGRRIDAYLQLKTCRSEDLRGKIVIDSPGFDADDQRNSTLRITDHIMELADLVLVFFDARHPEPGAMRDTLEHLVANTIHRHDSNKFLFVLNQIDCTAQEDNLEDVVAAWQRSLSQSGLTAGRFYQIYNKEAAKPIEDSSLRARYEGKREEDMQEIMSRIQQVEVERAYRIVGVLEFSARSINEEVIPRITGMLADWRNKVLMTDAIVLGSALVVMLIAMFSNALPWPGPNPAELDWSNPEGGFGLAHIGSVAILALFAGIGGYLHFTIRKMMAKLVNAKMEREEKKPEMLETLKRVFSFNTRSTRSLLRKTPSEWNSRRIKELENILKESDALVQRLNDQFTNPSGHAEKQNPDILGSDKERKEAAAAEA
ncbi:dynamin family protein [Magnetococcus sp. PR-3]|uniref:dynamin family protein n=1 Tax=Magnetococcus sp. PR-3 TaxID=3120355 RepID=UPI002FCDEAC9